MGKIFFMKNKYLNIILVVVAFILSFIVYRLIVGPVEFQKQRDEKYIIAIKRLMKIRDAQNAYKEATGKFTGSYDTLVSFIDTGDIVQIERKDTTVMVMDRRLGFEVPEDKQIVREVSRVKVKDSLFGGDDYKNLMYYPIGSTSEKIPMEAIYIRAEDSTKKGDWLFFAEMTKRNILKGEDENDIIVEENQEKGIIGKSITVGNKMILSTEGNWTKDLETEITKREKRNAAKEQVAQAKNSKTEQ